MAFLITNPNIPAFSSYSLFGAGVSNVSKAANFLFWGLPPMCAFLGERDGRERFEEKICGSSCVCLLLKIIGFSCLKAPYIFNFGLLENAGGL